jgi:hypothetical protein
MSVGDRGRSRTTPEYYVTKTILQAAEYGNSALPIVEALGFSHEDYLRAGGIGVIRCTVMDPFLADGRGKTDHVAGFIEAVREVIARELDG